MIERSPATVAIVDYRLGNLFSVKMACAAVGLDAVITSDRKVIQAADAIILPGVGAYGDAMSTLTELDLVAVLRDAAAAGKPILGVCLGLQLLLSESEEFGAHRGLGLIEGTVSHLEGRQPDGRPLKVPHVGWSRVHPVGDGRWRDTPLASVAANTFMYFVHSFVVRPADSRVVTSTTEFGTTSFCSSLQQGSIFACQFHPERSGRDGLQFYRGFAARVVATASERSV